MKKWTTGLATSTGHNSPQNRLNWRKDIFSKAYKVHSFIRRCFSISWNYVICQGGKDKAGNTMVTMILKRKTLVLPGIGDEQRLILLPPNMTWKIDKDGDKGITQESSSWMFSGLPVRVTFLTKDWGSFDNFFPPTWEPLNWPHCIYVDDRNHGRLTRTGTRESINYNPPFPPPHHHDH